MSESDKRIVEINGIKVEVDMRYARVIQHYRVGQNVKVLRKLYDGYKSYHGLIVGFDNFEKLPTLVVAVFTGPNYSTEANIEFVYFNSATKEVELAPAIADELPMAREDALGSFDRAIEKKESELRELREKRAYFDRKFGQLQDTQVPVNTEELAF